ncbi:hypothetical protein [Aquimarina sp. RZ0]|uniref:hypothetical protein n=1 Tax=Aquimarina sp. RZ0 TaxID=2607730 RepID=UPI0011F3E264|nr:hypothetical protein [Aquimarina sp. RZ0]KAA1247755.1 hypothetical protein F0000_02805 [Aquimarina sp. RZ0]
MIERRKGTIQHQRKNENLIRQDFKIDDRSFEDLLGYLISYAEYINFYNIDNHIDGNWKVLLEHDPILYMVTIIQEPVVNLTSIDDNKKTVQDILKWYDKIEKWKKDLIGFHEDILANKIGNIVSDVLQYQRENLSEYLNSIEEKEKPEPKSFSEAIQRYSKPPPKKREVDLPEVVETLKKIILHIQDFTKKYLRTYIFKRDDHLPNNAMYITFVMLYEKLQGHINQLSKKHLDFYYKEILQQTISRAIPTTAIVCFEATPKSKSTPIPEGTELSAGKLFGSKKEILFKTNKAILINPISIQSIETLFFNKSSFIKVGTDLPIISSILKNQLILNAKKNPETNNWALFGADQNTLINSEIAPIITTDVGFMIGSPVLFLEEGKREVTLSCTLEENSASHIFWKLLEQMTINEKLPFDVVCARVFEEAFIISYTSIKSWETVSSYEVSFNKEENTFIIHFVLQNTEAPVTALASEKEHSVWPMIRVIFDEYAPVYVYSFFKGVILEDITIDIEVTEIKNLAVYNNIGKMPLTKAFDLFGPLPAKGGYLMIGKSELFKKEITHIDIDIDWEAVPAEYGGFDTYYQEYTEAFANDFFKVKIQTLCNGYWFPREEALVEEHNLFETEDCLTPEGYDSTLVSSKKSFSLNNLGKYEFSRDYRLQDPLKYTIHTQSGFIKLTLDSPVYAFGKDLYQKNYTEIATYNAKNEEELPLPNKPFIPKVKGVTLAYKAKDVLYFNNSFSNDDSTGVIAGDYLHITPFSIQKIISDSKVYKNTIVTDYDGEGYFYIRLDGLSTGVGFSLFFDLQNQTTAYNSIKNNIVFQFKTSDSWTVLTEKYMISDSTNQLTKSGIIEFRLPSHITINKEDIFEIRCIAKKQAYTYPTIRGIYVNAVTASCTTENIDIVGKQIAANRITKIVKKIPGIKQVLQPAPSYGGKLPGTPDMLYTEVSERIRHKDRAVTLWDYERLTLQYFHEVIAAKCTNLNDNFKPQAGYVRLIVLSAKWENEHHHYFNGNELSQIAEFIQKKSNSFIKVKVQNPEVEWLLVNCIVTFYEEDDGGYYINELNKVISEYLCPMPLGNTNIEGIGATVEPRMLVSYIEDLPYIQGVEKLNIEHIVKKEMNDFTLKVYEESEMIRPTKPFSILAPMHKHHINSHAAIEETHGEATEEEMLNLQVGIDYIIEADEKESKQELEKSESSVLDTTTEVKPKKEIVPYDKYNTVLTFTIEK